MSNKTQESYDPAKLARMHRIMNVLAVVPAIIGILSIFYFMFFRVQEYLLSSVYTMVPLFAIGLSSMILLMRYLQTGALFRQPTIKESAYESPYASSYLMEKSLKDQENKIKELQTSITFLQDKIPEITTAQNLTSEQQESLLNNLKSRIESSATEEFLDKLRQEASQKFEQNNKIDMIDQNCLRTTERLNKETAALSRRGNLNLVLGIFTTIIGLLVLYIYVSKITVDVNNPWIAGLNFIPRLSLVILIELFAYFFLKLYKSNLSEIKYFQNELTNIEAKYVSLRTALINCDESTISEVIQNLSKTERNFILEKGQSTVDLEHTRINNEATTSITKSISEMIKNIKILK